MKHCPQCDTKYDDESIRFCTKDGTPLINEEEPNFITMPSSSLNEAEDADDDPGEITVIRRNTPPAPPPTSLDEISFEASETPAQRIVVPATEEEFDFAPKRPPANAQAYYPPPQRSNTALVVVVTFFGTVIILGIAGILFWLLQQGNAGNTNSNLNANLENANTNLNTNLGIDTNFNFNTNSSINSNANSNANLKTPTPTPKPTPSITPTPTPDETETPAPNTNTRTPFPGPSPNVTPRSSPQPPSNRSVNGGVLNGRALSLPSPAYPPLARQMHASGQVTVQVSVDENGRVISARAVSGHPLLRGSAESAARQSRINPIRVDNERILTTGVLIYNFRDN